MKTTFLVSLFLMLNLILVSCGKNTKDARIIIEFDDATKRKIQEMRSLSKFEKEFGLEDPANIGEINCFGVMVTYPELLPINSCTVDQGPVVAVRPDVGKGLVDLVSGAQIDMLVKSGTNRTIQLIGFKSQITPCPGLPGDFSALESSMSKPFILGQLNGVEIIPGEQPITMTASYYPASTTRLTDCKGPMFGTMPPPFLLCLPEQGCRHWLTARNSERLHPDDSCLNPIADGFSVQCWQNILGAEMRNTSNSFSPNYIVDAGGSGKHMVKFDGSDDYLEPALGWIPPAEGSILVVFKHGTMGTTETLIGVMESVKNISLQLINDSGNKVSATIGSSTLKTTSTFVSDSLTVLFMSYKPGTVAGDGRVEICINHDCTEDSAQNYSISPAISYPFRIGAKNNMGTSTSFTSSYIGEIIIYNRALYSTERYKAIELLKQAWGI